MGGLQPGTAFSTNDERRLAEVRDDLAVTDPGASSTGLGRRRNGKRGYCWWDSTVRSLTFRWFSLDLQGILSNSAPLFFMFSCHHLILTLSIPPIRL